MNDCTTTALAQLELERARQRYNAQHRTNIVDTIRIEPITQRTMIGIDALNQRIAANARAVAEIARRTKMPEILVRERALDLAHNSTAENLITYEDALAMAMAGKVTL